ncbi:class I SAM-dependent methyltransferase [Azospirillum argentinense]|nr:class I SAM-dependent methyltransferase [Azospirillum argentinense]
MENAMNEAKGSADVSGGSPERFGYSWNQFNELSQEQEEQFRRWTIHLDPEVDWKGKTFLDAGCGAGRNSHWAMKFGAAGGVGIDLDERSLGAARRNLAGYGSVQILEKSIYDIGFQGAFDIAFSLGVIHHLDNPLQALRQMRQATRPGGKVLIWVYGYENMEFYVNVLDPVRRALFSRLPIRLVSALSHLPASALWAMLRSGLHPSIEYFRLLRGFPYAHLRHIVFDQMLPRTANYWRREEVEALMTQAGLEDIRLEWVNQMSWSAIGTVPRG